MKPNDRRELNRGFAQSFNRSFELVLCCTALGFGGWWIDGKLGTSPVFAIVLAGLGLVGQFVRMWTQYEAEMQRHEAALPSRIASARRATTRSDTAKP